MDLTPAQEAEARRIYEVLKAEVDVDLMAVARLLAGKADGDLCGRTEFEVRDRVHGIGAAALETALAGRKKGGTWGAVSRAAGATAGPGSTGTRPGDG